MKNICNHCGSLDTLKNKNEGSNRGDWFLMIIILCLLLTFFLSFFVAAIFFVIGVIIIFLLKPRRKFTVCQSCGAENSFINLETPKGKELLEKYHKDIKEEESKPISKEQTWHGLW